MRSACIIPARPGDYLQIAALDRLAWPDEPDTFIPDGEHIWRIWCEYAAVHIARTNGERLPESGEIAGAVVVFPTSCGESFLHKVMVHPACRGQGLGTQLMQAALENCLTRVLLTVDPANTQALAVYRHLGFEVRETVPGYYRPHETRHVMVKEPEKPGD